MGSELFYEARDADFYIGSTHITIVNHDDSDEVTVNREDFGKMCQRFLGIETEIAKWTAAIREVIEDPNELLIPLSDKSSITFTEMYLRSGGAALNVGRYRVTFYGTDSGTILGVIGWWFGKGDDGYPMTVVIERCGGIEWYRKQEI